MARGQPGAIPDSVQSKAARANYQKAWDAFVPVRDRLAYLDLAQGTLTLSIDAAKRDQAALADAIGTAADANTAFDLEVQLRAARESERASLSSLAAVRAELPGVRARFAELRAALDVAAGVK